MFVVFTPPDLAPEKAGIYNRLFRHGLACLMLRLPKASRQTYEKCILAIEPLYRERIILCDHFDLLKSVSLGGAHLNKANRSLYAEVTKYTERITTSCHSFEELQSLPFRPTFAFLSPIFDSICKVGYKSQFQLEECREQLARIDFPVVALGGISPESIKKISSYGFAGAAAMGYFYGKEAHLLEAFLAFPKTPVLSIAGHDPSSGAGLVADALNIEHLHCYPHTIVSTLTIQNESEFIHARENAPEDISLAIEHFDPQHSVRVAKIGLTHSWQEVQAIGQQLRKQGIKTIVHDPIVKPSKGNQHFLYKPTASLLHAICRDITLITPNQKEAEYLFGSSREEELSVAAKTSNMAILLKGVQDSKSKAIVQNILFEPSGRITHYPTATLKSEKHGTGCALSAAIACYLAQGYELRQACRLAQWYVDTLLRSSQGFLSLRNDLSYIRKNRALESNHLQYITDSEDPQELLLKVEKVLLAGIRWIQLRMKKAPHETLVAVAKQIKGLVDQYDDATFIINDDVAAVLESDADGVHLGLDDMRIAEARKILGYHRIIGGTCNTPEDLYQRALEGADYIGVGPYKPTSTKQNLSPLLAKEGITQLLEKAKELSLSFPIIAIGGIEEGDLEDISQIGASGVAISGAINRKENTFTAANDIATKVNALWQKTIKESKS